MPTDLEGELDVLGTWLQRHQETITGGRIRATVGSRRLASGSPDPVEVVLDDAVPGGPGGPGGRVAARPDRRHPIRRTSWLVAAAIVLVCLAAGTFLALTRPGSAPASLPTGPTDPTGALYVMPSAGSAAPTRNATSMAAAVAPSRREEPSSAFPTATGTAVSSRSPSSTNARNRPAPAAGSRSIGPAAPP